MDIKKNIFISKHTVINIPCLILNDNIGGLGYLILFLQNIFYILLQIGRIDVLASDSTASLDSPASPDSPTGLASLWKQEADQVSNVIIGWECKTSLMQDRKMLYQSERDLITRDFFKLTFMCQMQFKYRASFSAFENVFHSTIMEWDLPIEVYQLLFLSWRLLLMLTNV